MRINRFVAMINAATAASNSQDNLSTLLRGLETMDWTPEIEKAIRRIAGGVMGERLEATPMSAFAVH